MNNPQYFIEGKTHHYGWQTGITNRYNCDVFRLFAASTTVQILGFAAVGGLSSWQNTSCQLGWCWLEM